MIKFEKVFIQYVKEFFSLYDFSYEISSHTLFVGDFFNGTYAIMRTLAKIDRHYIGEIFIDDINLKNIKEKDLNISYLPENPVLFENKNIFKNLFYPLKIRKINKKTAKNLINSVFLDLKNNNFEIFNNYLKNQNINKKLKNAEFINFKNDEILKLKIKKVNLCEQKIIALIRTILRSPKYVLLENFFEDLEENYIPLAEYLINKLKQTSTIIACEKENKNYNIFKDFRTTNLATEIKEKKED